MRRIILAVVALAMLGAGGYVLLLDFGCMLGFSAEACRVNLKIAAAAGFIAAIGIYLLWEEFGSRRSAP